MSSDYRTTSATFHRFQGDMEPIALYGDYIESILRRLDNLHPLTRQAIAVERPDRVFVSALETGKLVILNYRDDTAYVKLAGRLDEAMPPYSIRVVPGE